MNKTSKYGLLLVLFVGLLLLTNQTRAQFVPDDNLQAKEIITVMQNSAEEWNRGDLPDFMLTYDPSATMMSLCLFPNTKGLYQNQ